MRAYKVIRGPYCDADAGQQPRAIGKLPPQIFKNMFYSTTTSYNHFVPPPKTTAGCHPAQRQQWRYPHLTRNTFCILFPAKGTMSYRYIICLKGTCSLANRGLQHPWVNRLNNVIIWKFLKSIAVRTTRPRSPYAARGPSDWDPWLKVNTRVSLYITSNTYHFETITTSASLP